MKFLTIIAMSLLLSAGAFAKRDHDKMDFDARIKATEERFDKHIGFLEESKKIKIEFLTKMKDMVAKLQAAKGEDKEAIKNEMKTLREAHKSQMKARREEMKKNFRNKD